MKKELLLKMAEKMTATEKMLQDAVLDVPRKSGYFDKRDIYRYAYHASFFIENGIAVLALFGTKELRVEAKKPVYILFFDRENEDFITYETERRKWRKAMVSNLLQFDWNYQMDMIHIEDDDYQRLCEYFTADAAEHKKTQRIADEFQKGIHQKRLETKWKVETDRWDAVMEKVPALPKDWKHWVEKTGVTEHFLFYDAGKRVKEGYCSHCKNTVPIIKPRYNKRGRCPRCGKEVTYKSRGKAGTVVTPIEDVYLLQKYEGDRILVRNFKTQTFYRKGNYENPENHCHEVWRFIFDRENEQIFYHGLYKQRVRRWIKGMPPGGLWTPYIFYLHKGRVYRRTIPPMKNGLLGKTGFPEMLAERSVINPEKYLSYWQAHPYIEQLIKAGLMPLALNLFDKETKIEWGSGRRLCQRLGIDGAMLRQLRDNNGDKDYLEWLQMEKRQGGRISDDLIRWFLANGIPAEKIGFIRDRMRPEQIRNYLERQWKKDRRKKNKNSYADLLEIWRDYLSMAEKLGMDTDDEIIYRAKELVKRHDEAAFLLEQKRKEEHIAEMEKLFPELPLICAQVKDQYEYLEEDTYAVLMPREVRDIVDEGRALHHCVGSGDHYFAGICRRESYILFLRKQSDLKKAFYTLEVRPDGTILQWRSEYNRRTKDEKEVEAFLGRWKKAVRDRQKQQKAGKRKSQKVNSLALLQKGQAQEILPENTAGEAVDVKAQEDRKAA
ncbi:MAG: PcfJ domain-containing protein [Lachnospiraceae bacterium]|nr:PcfJ domain-containing protein [Lachnospiraceae bacterium]